MLGICEKLPLSHILRRYIIGADMRILPAPYAIAIGDVIVVSSHDSHDYAVVR